jgi:hypothetical protein
LLLLLQSLLSQQCLLLLLGFVGLLWAEGTSHTEFVQRLLALHLQSCWLQHLSRLAVLVVLDLLPQLHVPLLAQRLLLQSLCCHAHALLLLLVHLGEYQPTLAVVKLLLWAL